MKDHDLSAENSAREVAKDLENQEANNNVKTNPAPSDEILSNHPEEREEESPLNINKEKSAINENGGNKGLLQFQDYLSDGFSFLQNNNQGQEKPSGHINYGGLEKQIRNENNKSPRLLKMVKTFKLGKIEYNNIFQLKESNIELAQNSTESDVSDEEGPTEREEINTRAVLEENDGTESEDNDELNSSDIYPLEIKTTFLDTNQAESYVYYLNVTNFFWEQLLIKNFFIRREWHI